MSILIKNMEMPKNCGECELCGCYTEIKGEVHRCDISMYVIKELERRLEDCPLVEVPPHGRLIDAGKLNVVNDRPHEITLMETDNLQEVLEKWISDAPTVIEAEDGE